MCYRTKLNSKLSSLEKSLDARFIEPEKYKPQDEINAFSFAETPVITDENPGEINIYHWGLIPFWAKDDNIKKRTLNSKIETASEKPAFRNSVNNRCLVIADGYYEWQWLDSKGKEKQKFLIQPVDQEIFSFAGIYSSWKNPQTNELVNSYSILTTEANELMNEIHNNKKRMPVVLKNKDMAAWLAGDDLEKFAFPYEVELKAKPVS
ncbi:SOS response-associated peptidase [Gramella sp. MT6]|uniref:SOS response-associated peptidase n=1 Tax=Gramella sp. MT6 TaxID=2705471 RepID=UPI001C5E4220|nr:SOS response-associated peptidase [Gramella sp. MT6]QYA26459.1 SOS response-associated peptidase [Gramella sp. MT6]